LKGAVIMAEGVVVTANDLGLKDPGDDPEYLNLRVARQRAETQAVRQALGVARANLSRAAELLGVTRPTLYDLIERHHIDVSTFGRNASAEGDRKALELEPEAKEPPSSVPTGTGE
jgi:DNA-binding NtrC family response regulator